MGVMCRAVVSKVVVNPQPLVLVLRRENGPQLPDHCQDVPELELGNPWNERPTRLAWDWLCPAATSEEGPSRVGL